MSETETLTEYDADAARGKVETEFDRRVGDFDTGQSNDLSRQTSAAGSASSSAVDEIEQRNRETSAVIAQYGQAGRDSLDRFKERNAQDADTAISNYLAGQQTRSTGTMSETEKAALSNPIRRQYARAGEDMDYLGNMQMDNWDRYGAGVSNYMSSAQASSPLIAQQIIGDLQASQGEARRNFMTGIEDWRTGQYEYIQSEENRFRQEAADRDAAEKAEAEKLPSRLEMEGAAMAAGETQRQRELADLYGMRDMFAENQNVSATNYYDRKIAELEAKPTSSWHREAAAELFGDIGYALFDAGTVAPEGMLNIAQANAYADSRSQAFKAARVGPNLWEIDGTGDAESTASRREKYARERAFDTDLDAMPGTSEAVASYLKNGFGLSQDEVDDLMGIEGPVDIVETEDYENALGWANDVAAAGGSQEEAQEILLAAGYPIEVVTELLKNVNLGEGSLSPDFDELDKIRADAEDLS